MMDLDDAEPLTPEAKNLIHIVLQLQAKEHLLREMPFPFEICIGGEYLYIKYFRNLKSLRAALNGLADGAKQWKEKHGPCEESEGED